MGAGFYENTNGVPLENGRVHHLGLAPGEVANRVVSVGSLSRATLLRGLLDAPGFELTSARGFTTFTSTYGGVPVSVVATGMGGPMMDFVVRETRAVTAGPMSFVRLGSCGGVSEAAAPGVVVANTPGSVAVSRNLDHDDQRYGKFRYWLLRTVTNVKASPLSEIRTSAKPPDSTVDLDPDPTGWSTH